MTAHTLPDEVEKCLAAGMNAHTSKPIDLAHLLGVLQTWLGPRRQAGPARPVTHRPQTLPGFDMAHNAGRDWPAFLKLLADFRAEFGQTATTLRTLLDAGDRAVGSALLHHLKGISGNIGALDLHDACAEPEACVKQDGAIPPEAMHRFEVRLEEVLASIATLE